MKNIDKKGGIVDWLLRQNPLAVTLFFAVLMLFVSLYAGDRYEETVRTFKAANPVVQKTPPGYVPPVEEVVVDNTERGMGFLDEILMDHSVASVLVVATLVLGTLLGIPFLTLLFYYQKRRDDKRREAANLK